MSGPTQVARESGTAPGGNGVWSDFLGYALSDTGQVAFLASFMGTAACSNDDQGLFLSNPQDGFTTLAREDAALDGGVILSLAFSGGGDADGSASGYRDAGQVASGIASRWQLRGGGGHRAGAAHAGPAGGGRVRGPRPPDTTRLIAAGPSGRRKTNVGPSRLRTERINLEAAGTGRVNARRGGAWPDPPAPAGVRLRRTAASEDPPVPP